MVRQARRYSRACVARARNVQYGCVGRLGGSVGCVEHG